MNEVDETWWTIRHEVVQRILLRGYNTQNLVEALLLKSVEILLYFQLTPLKTWSVMSMSGIDSCGSPTFHSWLFGIVVNTAL